MAGICIVCGYSTTTKVAPFELMKPPEWCHRRHSYKEIREAWLEKLERARSFVKVGRKRS